MLKGVRATPSLILFSRVQRSWKCKNILCGRECTVPLPDGRTSWLISASFLPHDIYGVKTVTRAITPTIRRIVSAEWIELGLTWILPSAYPRLCYNGFKVCKLRALSSETLSQTLNKGQLFVFFITAHATSFGHCKFDLSTCLCSQHVTMTGSVARSISGSRVSCNISKWS